MVPIKEEAAITLRDLRGLFPDALSYALQDISIILLFFARTFTLISKSALPNWLLRLALAFSWG